MSQWWEYESTRPIRVDGGIRARSTRGAIGASWWSRRFIAVLESFAVGTRLTRGRGYARAGQVLTLEIAAGTVTATVQGSRPTPYRVRIGLAPFDDPTWARLEAVLAGQAVHSAALLAGEVPPELEQAVESAGASLFPTRFRDLDMRCSCPDAAVPCKHIAAVFYLLAESFDADPFGILRWRGRDRETLLARLRELRSGGDGHGGSRAGRGSRPRGAAPDDRPAVWGASAALEGLQAADPAALTAPEEFWWSPLPLPEPAAAPKVDPDLLLRGLPEPPAALGGEPMRTRLEQAYRAFGAADDEPTG